MPHPQPPLGRARAFAADYGLQAPILMAPMAGVTDPALAIAVANGGGMAACGALMLSPDQILEWGRAMRAGSNGAFQLNTWIPEPAPTRDSAHEAAMMEFLSEWGPPPKSAEPSLQDFDQQCEAMLSVGPEVISSVMGVFPPEFVAKMKSRGIKWFAAVTTVGEARQAEDAGADVIIAQGAEAGGHRGSFEVAKSEEQSIGLISLIPAVVDAVDVPVVATGGIADGRAVAAALILGASAVQVGTALLRAPEAGIAKTWADAIGAAAPEDTVGTRAFSGRLGRSLRTAYVEAAHSAAAPKPAPYPVQRQLTNEMRSQASKDNLLNGIQAWAGQSAGLARVAPAKDIVEELWRDAQALLT
ncbi:MAG: nitronate monooxygenase [Pseudomonadota bacterium]